MKLTSSNLITAITTLSTLTSYSSARPTTASTSRNSVTERSTASASSGVIEVPLHRRVKRGGRSAQDFLAQAHHMKNKYGHSTPASKERLRKLKARAGVETLTAYEDSEFFGSIQIGTPATTYSVILDTGSADLIMAEPDCNGCSSTTKGYTTSQSSTAQSSSTTFQIQYGSGSASGHLVSDNVSIAGYTLSNQVFASCPTMDNIVAGNISGLLGLGWQNLATSGSTPLVEALAQAGDLPAEVFAFKFDSNSYESFNSDYLPGGKMTIGGTDTSAYSGDINWISLSSSTQTYWQIPLDGVSVGGTSVGVSANSVVIDTGTTLIGMPQSAVETIYSQISGAQPVTLSGEDGYYSIPCSGSYDVSFTFGGVSYSIPSDSFNAGAFNQAGTECLGAIFVLTSGQSSPASSNTLEYIIGDAFLTGVYSAFRFSSPAVGFAKLGSGGTAVSGSNSSSSNGYSFEASAAPSSFKAGATVTTGLALAAAVFAVLI